jgi:AcrR family transcriptional regulator
MMDESEARERVLAAAERLFAERGYAAVTLRDIAAAVGIRHASTTMSPAARRRCSWR